MSWFFKRISEPSTHAGLAVICQVVKTMAPQYGFVFDALSMLTGGAATVMSEKKL
jgi:hypothetical protein